MATVAEPAKNGAPNPKLPFHKNTPEFAEAKENDEKIPPLQPVTGYVKREEMDAMLATIGEITGVSGMNEATLAGILDDAKFAPVGNRSTKETFVRKDKRSCQRLSFGSEGVKTMMPILADLMKRIVRKYPRGTRLHVEPTHFDAMLYRNRDGGLDSSGVCRAGGGGDDGGAGATVTAGPPSRGTWPLVSAPGEGKSGEETVINDHFDFHRDGEFMFGCGGTPFGTSTFADVAAAATAVEAEEDPDAIPPEYCAPTRPTISSFLPPSMREDDETKAEETAVPPTPPAPPVPMSKMMQYSLLICVDSSISDHTSGNTDVYLPSAPARWLNYWAINALEGMYPDEIEWKTRFGVDGVRSNFQMPGKNMRLHSFPQSRTPLKYVLIPGNALHRGNSIDCTNGYKMILKFDIFIEMPVPTVAQIVSKIEKGEVCGCLYCSPVTHMKGTDSAINMASRAVRPGASTEPSAPRVGMALPSHLRSMIASYLVKNERERLPCKEAQCSRCSATACDCCECIAIPGTCYCDEEDEYDDYWYDREDDFCNGYEDEW